ncbi:hypothetical protein EI427_01685 [Flammeovirga pectinis]|uniref:DUF4625 domain-containing protein n=1 Tax=Flammeovirga pectinis TaxID=2494373 RepID=A0A3Q9FLJ5_9BACT|nr:hypothetical protein [Flammeovirga pectinis]AZQ60970.1 hypothetical protein EI427_01685 [Flammeovirga pectinis]
MKSLRNYSILLLSIVVVFFSSCSKDQENDFFGPNVRIKNAPKEFKVKPLSVLEFDVEASTISDFGLSSINFEPNSNEIPNQNKGRYKNSIFGSFGTYKFKGYAPLKKGSYDYKFVAYTIDHQKTTVKQKVTVTKEPLILTIENDKNLPTELKEKGTYKIKGTIESVRSFEYIRLSTSAFENPTDLVKYDQKSRRTSKNTSIYKHTSYKVLTHDLGMSDGYHKYAFEVEFTVTKGRAGKDLKEFKVALNVKDDAYHDKRYRENSLKKEWSHTLKIK